MSKNLRNILAICIAILPINGYMIWYRLTQTEAFTTADMLGYPLVIGGLSIVLILALNKYLVQSTFSETFNSGQKGPMWDLLTGIGITIVYFVMFFLERATIYQWFPNRNQNNEELFNVVVDLANDPLMLIIWFGPVLWIGIALFEEISRVFLLKCLWNISDNKQWEIIVIILTSALIGFVHIYQGTAGAITIGLKSLVACYFFYKYRRLKPLILSHVLYDGLQLAVLVIQIRN